MRKAVVLLSGGIDSTTSLFWAKSKGFLCLCLIFDYGQRHKKEIEKAKQIAKISGCEYKVLKINLGGKSSSLVNRSIKLDRKIRDDYIPSTYVPARNIIFLSFATSFAENINADRIVIGTNQVDYSNYPDCRVEFLKAFQKAINEGTKPGITGRPFKIQAPLENKTKSQIIKLAKRLGVPLELTWSCYAGGGRPCGKCPSCMLRAKGFEEARIKDPLLIRCIS